MGARDLGGHEPRGGLLVEQHAPLALELGGQQTLDRGEGVGGLQRSGARLEADAGPGADQAVVAREQGCDVREAQRAVDAPADRVEDLLGRPAGVQLGRDREQQARPVAHLVGELRPQRLLDGGRHVRRRGDEDVELEIGRPAPGGGLVDREDAEQTAARVAQRREERVPGMPGLGVAGRGRGSGRRHGPARVAGGGRVVAVAEKVGAAAHVAVVEQLFPGRARGGPAEQRGARLGAPVDGDDLEVVPRGPDQVDHDGAVAQRPAERPGDLVERDGPRRAPGGVRDAQQRPEVGDRAALEV